MNIYEKCPILENDDYILRLFKQEDLDGLLKVYSNKNVLPFINSDNCDGDNFYYFTKEKMQEVLGFWDMSYKKGWFVRFSIIDKKTQNIIGSVELCKRVSNDEYNNMGILRVDTLKENKESLLSVFSLITPHVEELMECNGFITKAPIYAVDRIDVLKQLGYVKSDIALVDKNNTMYYDYWKKIN